MENNQSCIRLFADKVQINNCREKLQTNQIALIGLSNIFALAGNDVRLKILYLLHEEKELCVCDLSDILEMKIPAVSQHLRKLKDGALVNIRKDGPTYYYYLEKGLPDVLLNLLDSITTKQIVAP